MFLKVVTTKWKKILILLHVTFKNVSYNKIKVTLFDFFWTKLCNKLCFIQLFRHLVGLLTKIIVAVMVTFLFFQDYGYDWYYIGII